MQIVFVVLLGICAIHDMCSKKIPAFWIWGILGLAAIYRLTTIVSGQGTVTESLLCLMPGIFLLFFSHWGRGIGNGDGWLIIASGLFWEWASLIRVLLYSFSAASLFSIGYLLIGHKNRKETIPFVPFLFVGMQIFILGDLI